MRKKADIPPNKSGRQKKTSGKMDSGVKKVISAPESTDDDAEWTVKFTGRSRKQKEKLPPDIKKRLQALRKSLELIGPTQKKWPHYGPVLGKPKGQDYRHCHLNKDQPIYVVVWKVTDPKARILEVKHVNTHEKTVLDRIR